eukprot:6588126-Prymnesium_polylepis.2
MDARAREKNTQTVQLSEPCYLRTGVLNTRRGGAAGGSGGGRAPRLRSASRCASSCLSDCDLGGGNDVGRCGGAADDGGGGGGGRVAGPRAEAAAGGGARLKAVSSASAARRDLANCLSHALTGAGSARSSARLATACAVGQPDRSIFEQSTCVAPWGARRQHCSVWCRPPSPIS